MFFLLLLFIVVSSVAGVVIRVTSCGCCSCQCITSVVVWAATVAGVVVGAAISSTIHGGAYLLGYFLHLCACARAYEYLYSVFVSVSVCRLLAYNTYWHIESIKVNIYMLVGRCKPAGRKHILIPSSYT